MRIPDFVTTEEVRVYTGIGQKTLPPESFVKPITNYHLPRHIKDSDNFVNIDFEKYTYAYTHFGIVVVPWASLREV